MGEQMTKPKRIEAGLRCCASTNVLKCDGCWYHGLRNCRGQLLKDVQQYIENIKRVSHRIEETLLQLEAAQPKWISVEERLPEESFEVLMLFKHNMAVGWYGGESDWYSNTDDGYYASCDREPTHWMPLPEPPKEDV